MSQMITSASNPRVKALVGLHKRRARSRAGVTVIEGYEELSLAIEAGVVPRELYWSPEVASPGRAELADRIAALGSEVVALGRVPFAKVSYRDTPDGFLAVVDDPERSLDELALPADPLLLVCEQIEKPGNLGAMLRTAEAAGVDAVIAASPVTDWSNPNVVRGSKGTLFALQVAGAPAEEVADWLAARGVRMAVATPEADATLTEVDLTGPTAIVVGAEHDGVGELLKQRADVLFRLPMSGRVNSLNVATAAAISLYEAVRQRG